MDANNTAFLYLHTAYTWMGIRLVRVIFTARIRSLQRLCFHRCLSVDRGGCLPHGILGYSLPDQTPTHGQTPPLDRPPNPQADTPPPAQYMLGYTPPCPVHAGIHPPLRSACWDTVNKRAVRIPLECILVTHLITLRITKELERYLVTDNWQTWVHFLCRIS